MAEEKIVTLNFRKLLKATSRTKRKSRTLHYLRAFLEKKSDKTRIDVRLSRNIWSMGSKGALGKIKIKLRKLDDGTLVAENAE